VILAFRHCERSEAIQSRTAKSGLLRRFAPRNDGSWQRVGKEVRCSPKGVDGRVPTASTLFVHQVVGTLRFAHPYAGEGQVGRLIASTSLPPALMRAMASLVFSIAVAM
jgi:hypothetical protein